MKLWRIICRLRIHVGTMSHVYTHTTCIHNRHVVQLINVNINANVNVNVSVCIAHCQQTPNALGALVPCEQKCLYQAPESSFGGVRTADRVRKTVPGGWTSNRTYGRRQAFAIASPSACNSLPGPDMQWILLSGTEMSVVGY